MSAAERREHEDATCKMVGSPFQVATGSLFMLPLPVTPLVRGADVAGDALAAMKALDGPPPRWNERRVLIFAENREGTKRYLRSILEPIEGSDRADERIEVIEGFTRGARRKEIQRRFNAEAIEGSDRARAYRGDRGVHAGRPAQGDPAAIQRRPDAIPCASCWPPTRRARASTSRPTAPTCSTSICRGTRAASSSATAASTASCSRRRKCAATTSSCRSVSRTASSRSSSARRRPSSGSSAACRRWSTTTWSGECGAASATGTRTG